MAMDLNAKAAYIRGLMNGMEFDPNSKNGRIIAAMMDLLEEMAAYAYPDLISTAEPEPEPEIATNETPAGTSDAA